MLLKTVVVISLCLQYRHKLCNHILFSIYDFKLGSWYRPQILLRYLIGNLEVVVLGLELSDAHLRKISFTYDIIPPPIHFKSFYELLYVLFSPKRHTKVEITINCKTRITIEYCNHLLITNQINYYWINFNLSNIFLLNRLFSHQ